MRSPRCHIAGQLHPLGGRSWIKRRFTDIVGDIDHSFFLDSISLQFFLEDRVDDDQIVRRTIKCRDISFEYAKKQPGDPDAAIQRIRKKMTVNHIDRFRGLHFQENCGSTVWK